MTNPRGRTAGFKMPEEHRLKIANSNILRALIEHACGEREMSPSQVTAGLGLLKKVLPDLQAITHSGDDASPIAHIHRIERVIVNAKHPDSGSVPPAAPAG
jgi:hypothetical protein